MASLSEVLEKRKREREQQKLDSDERAYILRPRPPVLCHGFECHNAVRVDDEVYCHSLELSSRPALISTLTACPESCWDSEPEQPGFLGESIAEAKRVLHESSRAVLDLEREIGKLNDAQRGLELSEMNMNGKFERLLADCRKKKGDPSKRLDQGIWSSGCERIRAQNKPHIDKLYARLAAVKKRRADAMEVLTWLTSQNVSVHSPEFFANRHPEAASSVMSKSFPLYQPKPFVAPESITDPAKEIIEK